MTQWKLRRRGRTVGPLPTSELLRALQLGKVPIDSEAQRVGDDDWAPLVEFVEFSEEIARDTPTHIMSSPWFLDSAAPRDRATARDYDPTEVLLESTPLPVPAAMRTELSIPPMAAIVPGPGAEARSPMATVPDPSPPVELALDPELPGPARGFVPSDSEPITPRVPHQIVPAAAVPPADEISAHRSRTSVRAAPPPDPPETTEAGQSERLAVFDISDHAGLAPVVDEPEAPLAVTTTEPAQVAQPVAPASRSPGIATSPPTEDALLRSLLEDPPSPTPGGFNLARSALGGPASPLDAMLAEIGHGQRQGSPSTPAHPEPSQTVAVAELTPVSGTASLAHPQQALTTSADAQEPEEIEAPEYVDDELQDAILDGDAESAPQITLQPVTDPLGPDMMNRIESHGPAPIPQPERRGMTTHQETTSPALRAYTPQTGGGRAVLWILILILTLALGAAVYAIVAR